MITVSRVTALLTGAAIGLAVLSAPASARVFVGVGIGVPVEPYYAPPVYAPPPVYYAPPPTYYAAPPVAYSQPPASYAPVSSGICYAGVYTCPVNLPAGSECSCPAIGAPSYGTVR